MASTLVVLARQTPLNGGTTVPGAKLFVYNAGTTTKRAIYTTSALSVQHSNPVVADSNGRLPAVWVDSTGGDYKIVLAPAADSDPPTSAFWTDDNLPSGDVGDEQLSANVALRDESNTFSAGIGIVGTLSQQDASGTNLAMTAWLSWRDGTNTERGWVGFGDGSTLMRIKNNVGAIDLNALSLIIGQGLKNYADDAAAAAGGEPIGGIYRTASAVKIRVA